MNFRNWFSKRQEAQTNQENQRTQERQERQKLLEAAKNVSRRWGGYEVTFADFVDQKNDILIQRLEKELLDPPKNAVHFTIRDRKHNAPDRDPRKDGNWHSDIFIYDDNGIIKWHAYHFSKKIPSYKVRYGISIPELEKHLEKHIIS